MNLRSFTTLTAIVLIGIVLSDCKSKKEIYTIGLQTKSESIQTSKSNSDQLTITKNAWGAIQNEPLNVKEEIVITEINEMTASQQITLKESDMNLKSRQIRKYRVFYIDGTDFIEKREMIKCYEDLNSVAMDDVVDEEVESNRAASLILPILLPVTLVLFIWKIKSNATDKTINS